MDKILNVPVLMQPLNWPLVWLMGGLGLFLVRQVSRALPDIVPTESK